ncbi:MAG: helix-turn-helix domain-containing protein [Kiritimatiellia bacterium]
MKKPHIELSIHGEHVGELLAWIREKYDLTVLASEPDDELVSIESTDYWKEMEKNRIGNLLAGARLKAGLTQAQLAGELGIRQNMVSDYENGRRIYSDTMAKRLSTVLKVKEEHVRYGSAQSTFCRQVPSSIDPDSQGLTSRD